MYFRSIFAAYRIENLTRIFCQGERTSERCFTISLRNKSSMTPMSVSPCGVRTYRSPKYCLRTALRCLRISRYSSSLYLGRRVSPSNSSSFLGRSFSSKYTRRKCGSERILSRCSSSGKEALFPWKKSDTKRARPDNMNIIRLRKYISLSVHCLLKGE